MNKKQLLVIASVLLSTATLNAEAALTSYTGIGGVDLVYSSVSNVTWIQDANLFQTMVLANPNLVSQIASVTPTYNDPGYGLQTIDVGDLNTATGSMTWWGAKAFVNYLNSINYGGSTQWRLPTSNAVQGYDGTAGNELGQLFYSELGGSANNPIPNTSNFINELYSAYWSGTEHLNPHFAWKFMNDIGFQNFSNKDRFGVAWAVSSGQVSSVPIPSRP